ncbi:MAG: YbaK/EbsC family protein [Chloroflexota bacterium]
MAAVTNATRMLDARKIPYTAFELPEQKLGALEVATLLDTRPELVFKTIVVTRDEPGQPLLVLVSAVSTVDLKKVAIAVGEKRVHVPTEREAEEMTGLRAGGISPLALVHKGFRVLIDISAEKHPEIHVSGGKRGLNIKLRVADLARLTNARFAPISAPASGPDPDGHRRSSP